MDKAHIIFSSHALARMFERGIDPGLIQTAVEKGVVINNYPDDKPYPSRLLLYFNDGIAIHIVAADDEEMQLTYIITVYIPDPALWNDDFTKRRN